MPFQAFSKTFPEFPLYVLKSEINHFDRNWKLKSSVKFKRLSPKETTNGFGLKNKFL